MVEFNDNGKAAYGSAATPLTGDQSDGSYVSCSACRWEPPKERRRSFGTPVRMPGTTHYADCPTIPRLTLEDRRRLQHDLEEIAACERRAWAEARNVVVW